MLKRNKCKEIDSISSFVRGIVEEIFFFAVSGHSGNDPKGHRARAINLCIVAGHDSTFSSGVFDTEVTYLKTLFPYHQMFYDCRCEKELELKKEMMIRILDKFYYDEY